jgi:hypothetical protein
MDPLLAEVPALLLSARSEEDLGLALGPTDYLLRSV